MQKKKISVSFIKTIPRNNQSWFLKFCAGDFLLNHDPQLGQVVEVDSNQVKHYLRSIINIEKIANIFKNSKLSFENNFQWPSYVNHFDV